MEYVYTGYIFVVMKNGDIHIRIEESIKDKYVSLVEDVSKDIRGYIISVIEREGVL